MCEIEQAFRAKIAESPADEAPHKVFADWLDKQGRVEEGTFHRRWTVEIQRAEDWLREQVEKYSLFDGFPEAIRQVVEDRSCYGCGGESLRDDLADDPDFRADLFQHWQTYTGKPVSFRNVVDKYFSCGC